MARQAFHAGSTYRMYDGLGGAEGAVLRFEPERSLVMNTNMDKVQKILKVRLMAAAVAVREEVVVVLVWMGVVGVGGVIAVVSWYHSYHCC